MKKNEVQGILNEALDKYYMAGSAVVEVPEKIENVDKYSWDHGWSWRP